MLIQAVRNVLEQKKGLNWNLREEIETEVRVRIPGVFQSICQIINFFGCLDEADSLRGFCEIFTLIMMVFYICEEINQMRL